MKEIEKRGDITAMERGVIVQPIIIPALANASMDSVAAARKGKMRLFTCGLNCLVCKDKKERRELTW